MSSICATCLSSGRRLIPVKNIEKYKNILCLQFLDHFDSICWECESVVMKYLKFHHQAITAQNLLQNVIETQSEQKLVSYSNLKAHTCLNLECIDNPNLEEGSEVQIDIYSNDDKTLVIKNEPEIINQESTNLGDEKIKSDSDESIDNEYLKIEHKKKAKIKKKIKPRIKACGLSSETILIETTLFNIGRKREKMCFNLMEIEEKFIVKVLSEEDMLSLRESEKSMDKFRNSEFKCESCILTYKSEEAYKRHLSKRHVHNPSYHTCAICLVTSSTLESHTRHFTRHYVTYACKLCNYQNQIIRRMVEHNKHKHWFTRLYKCSTCGLEFSSGSSLRYHKSREHMELPPCEHCGKRFATKAGLKAHMVHHGGVTLFKCHICQKDYRGKFGLKAHMRTHDAGCTNENAFCAECNKQFKNVYIYNQHLRLNSKHRAPAVLKYKCSYCDKQFHQKVGLTIHEDSIHFKKRAFVCHICNKDFIRNDRLKKHILHDHEGVPKPRNHICPYCGKGFTSKLILNNHIRTHTGERPYQCEFCNTAFRQPTALKTHVKGVHQK